MVRRGADSGRNPDPRFSFRCLHFSMRPSIWCGHVQCNAIKKSIKSDDARCAKRLPGKTDKMPPKRPKTRKIDTKRPDTVRSNAYQSSAPVQAHARRHNTHGKRVRQGQVSGARAARRSRSNNDPKNRQAARRETIYDRRGGRRSNAMARA